MRREKGERIEKDSVKKIRYLRSNKLAVTEEERKRREKDRGTERRPPFFEIDQSCGSRWEEEKEREEDEKGGRRARRR